MLTPTRVPQDKLNSGHTGAGVAASLYDFVHGDALEWLESAEHESIHAVVTDPPFGLVEYSPEELEKRKNGNGGVWRQPQTLNGYQRQQVPRFTVLGKKGLDAMYSFFGRFSRLLYPILVPGAHVFISSNPLLSEYVFRPFMDAGFEKRGILIREVHTLRGGDRPKNAHKEFPDVTVMPKSCFEPWGIFRRPIQGRVQDNLREWGTGGLRRLSSTEPFRDLVKSVRTPRQERSIAPHPSLKPQVFLRMLVKSSLPLGTGIILDPFAGSGSTLAAATACGLRSVGIERSSEYYQMGLDAIPRLSALDV